MRSLAIFVTLLGLAFFVSFGTLAGLLAHWIGVRGNAVSFIAAVVGAGSAYLTLRWLGSGSGEH